MREGTVKKNTGYVMVLVASILWGCIGIFVNAISALGVSSGSMAAFRLLSGAVLLIPILAFMGARGEGLVDKAARSPLAYFRIAPRQLLFCALMGILAVAICNCCYYESMRAVGMSTASVLLYTQPVFACILGRLFFCESINVGKVIALVLNIAGCALAVTDGNFSSLSFSLYGLGVGVLSGFLAAFMPIFSTFATRNAHPLTVTFYGFVFGGTFMAAVFYPWADIVTALSPQLVLLFLGFGLIPTALAYIIYMSGLARGLEASKVPVIASLETVTSVLIGIALYAEPAGPVKIMGICLVLVSIAFMNLDARSFAAMKASPFFSNLSAALSYNPLAWNEQKATEYREFLDSGDWQTWVAPR